MGAPPKDPVHDIFLTPRTKPSATSKPKRWIALTLTALLAIKLYQLSPPLLHGLDVAQTFPWFNRNECIPPSPNLFALHPPRPSEKLIEKASKDADDWLRKRASKPDIDSISVGIVTPAGILFEGGYGVLKANETDKEGALPVDRNSIYRIASTTKMFTVLETIILREKGALNWDDPVDKYLPEVQPFSGGWAELVAGEMGDFAATGKPRITLRQLASHLAGIGRDYPPIPYPNWPRPLEEQPDIPFLNTNYSEIVKAIARYPLVNSPYHYPVYSNTGMNILGLANVAANAEAHSQSNTEPKTHRDLVQRDIFDTLGFTHSFYHIPNSSLRDAVAVPSSEDGINTADLVFADADEASGAQYSSMGDLAKLMQMILSPRDARLLSRDTVREWLRPIHNWNLGQSVGAPWEITTFEDVQVFSKGGNLPGYHSEFSLVPEYSYGIIVLVTGSYSDTADIVNEVLKRFHRAFKGIQEDQLKTKYAGKWSNGDDFFEISIRKGVPYVQKGTIGGISILDTMASIGDPEPRKGAPSALWPTGRPGEFRIAIGRPEWNNRRGAGCNPYWTSLDSGIHSRGAPVDLVYWSRGVLHYPSAGLSFSRQS